MYVYDFTRVMEKIKSQEGFYLLGGNSNANMVWSGVSEWKNFWHKQ